MAYDTPKQVHELDYVGDSLTVDSLITAQDIPGNRLGNVKPKDIGKIISIDDILDGSLFLKMTSSERQEIIDLRTDFGNHVNTSNNPHNVTAAQIGLGFVDNTADLEKPTSPLQQDSIDDAISSLNNTLTTRINEVEEHTSDNTNPHNVTASQIGLNKVNNTSDLEKPLSTATAAAISAIVAIVESGSNANGNYIKYADGTMICYINKQITDFAVNNGYSGAGLYYNNYSWTYPHAFASQWQCVQCSHFKWGTGASWGSVSQVEATTATLRCIDPILRNPGTARFSALAIGKWF